MVFAESVYNNVDAFNKDVYLSDDCPANCNGVDYWTDVTQGTTFPNTDFIKRFERNLHSNINFNSTASKMKFLNETYVRY